MGRRSKPDTLAMNQTLVAVALGVLGEAWGGAIFDYINERSIDRVTASSVYLALEDLEEKDYVCSRTESPCGRGGRPRKFYTLTSSGNDALKYTLASINQVAGKPIVFRPVRAT
jgi:DNA-binding PadR family transcriptional regulator